MTAPESVALILARGGSKGIPRKNLQRVGGISLVGRSVLAARAAKQVAAVFVSTDSKAIAEAANRHGATVVQRPATLAGDATSSEDAWLHALGEIKAARPHVARLVLLQCTSPFITAHDIDGCLDRMSAAEASSCLSVIPDHSFYWSLDDAGFAHGVNHDHKAPRQRRQDLPPQFRESGAIYCVDAQRFEQTRSRFCEPVTVYPVAHPPLEVDSPEDLAYCQAIAIAGSVGGASDPDREKLESIEVLAMDFDGVHTDDCARVDDQGTESVKVSRSDGMGIERLRMGSSIRMLILSKEKNEVVRQRAAKLKVECINAADDKVAALDEWLEQSRLHWRSVLFVGNDINDAEVLERCGLSACPIDAHPSILSTVDWVIPREGGSGVIRYISDVLLSRHSDVVRPRRREGLE